MDEVPAPPPPPPSAPAPGNIRHVRNNSGKKNNTVTTPVLSLGEHRFEVLDREKAASVEEEVAGMVSRLVHFTAFTEATQCNVELLLELEDYQKECWERERGRAASGGGGKKRGGSRGGKKKSSEATSSAGSSLQAGGGDKGSTQSLEEELYFSHLGLSLSSAPSKGFACTAQPSRRTTNRFADIEPPSSYPSPFLPGPASEAAQDPFLRKLGELQWLQSDTLRGEKAYSVSKVPQSSGSAGQGTGGPDAPAPRSRTPPRFD